VGTPAARAAWSIALVRIGDYQDLEDVAPTSASSREAYVASENAAGAKLPLSALSSSCISRCSSLYGGKESESKTQLLIHNDAGAIAIEALGSVSFSLALSLSSHSHRTSRSLSSHSHLVSLSPPSQFHSSPSLISLVSFSSQSHFIPSSLSLSCRSRLHSHVTFAFTLISFSLPLSSPSRSSYWCSRSHLAFIFFQCCIRVIY
jgi:hypothetical protein